ncbi:hypothetical protein EZS27_015118 [termite gut metagenome]|uniref:Uncharacterized protein n=1 Tax=termite gut metagenome TaxID=433724 RepID=A0A5J4RS71_9ZZZZ
MKKETIFSRVSEQSENLEKLVTTGNGAKTTTKSATTQNVNQLIRQAQFAAMVHVYQQLSYFLKGAYEKKTRRVSFFNLFMKLNLSTIKLFFTKTEAAEHACVVAPYRITEGSLPAIEIALQGNTMISSIAVPKNFVITSTTTRGEVSAALLKSNLWMHSGDQVSIVHLVQRVKDGIPRVSLKLHEFDLDRDSTEVFYEHTPESLFYVTGGHIGTDANAEEGGIAYVLSREMGNKLLVSRQEIVLTPGNTMYKKYSSEEKRKEAAASYVAIDPYFLKPGRGAEDDEEDTYFAITAVTLNGILAPKGDGELYVSSGDSLEIKGSKLTDVELKANAVVGGPTSNPVTVVLSSIGTITATSDTSITIHLTMNGEINYLLRADSATIVYSFC